MQTLQSSLCMLEPQVASHANEMFSVLSDPAIYEFENQAPVSKAWLTSRYELLERRASADGNQKWLNWVIRLPSGELAGYVQATVLQSRTALVAYELASRFWRRGVGSSALLMMMAELEANYGVRVFVAVLKAGNYRSLGLLKKLGFVPSSRQQLAEYEVEHDDMLLEKFVGSDPI